MYTANYSDVRKNFKQYLDRVTDEDDRFLIPRAGGKGVVMISLEDYEILDKYESIVETEYLMSSPAMMRAIEEAKKDLAEGRYTTLNGPEEIDAFCKQIEAEVAAEKAAETATESKPKHQPKPRLKSNVHHRIHPESQAGF